MQQSEQTRAIQHLLVQGFIAYPCHAGVCLWLQAPQVLQDINHPWAIYFDASASQWVGLIPQEDTSRIVTLMQEAAVRASVEPMVLCHALSEFLLLPLTVSAARGVRMQIEAAVVRGKLPSPEKLEAFSDEMLEAEFRKRKKPLPEEEGPG